MQQNSKRTSAAVLFLIGFVLGFGTPVGLAIYDNAVRPHPGSRVNRTRATITGIDTAIKTFKFMTGSCPQSADDLTAPIGKNPPLLKKEMLVDSWGTPFQVTFDGDTYEIRSAGPDKKFGTADDITN